MSESSLGHESILVVDDTVENLRLLSSMLTEHGYEVRPVTSARLAIQAVEHAPPDLILLDVNMPEMNGYDACARLQAMGFRDIPVIFLTALTDVADKVRAFDVGGADYVSKPFQIQEVLARVKAHLALRKARIDLQRNYDHLQQLEKLRDDLVHMIVHDMRSPLTALLGSLDFLVADVGGSIPDESKADLKAAVESASSLNAMANDLLDVSRLEAGQMPLDKRSADLTQIAHDARSRLAGMVGTRQVEIHASTPVDCVCDRDIVHRVVENLLSNAVKHTPAGGKIRITVTPMGANVRLEVSDEGPGVPLDARAKIFDKFSTNAERMQGRYHSVGLGLAFCKLAVEAHGGSISVSDGAPRGSIFAIDLPASFA